MNSSNKNIYSEITKKCKTPYDIFLFFTSKKMLKFITTFKFVNGIFLFKRNTYHITLKGIKTVPKYLIDIEWSSIKCYQNPVSYLKHSPCSVGHSTPKVFFKYAHTLDDYILKLYMCKITYEQHFELWKFLFCDFFYKQSFINHNHDVNTLHFKKL